MKIKIRRKEELQYTLPVYLFSFLAAPWMVLLFIQIFLTKVDWLVFGFSLFLGTIGIYSLYVALYDTFGEEIIILDNQQEIMIYEKSLFGFSRRKVFEYKGINGFIAENEPFAKKTAIPARCSFKYCNKIIRFGFLREFLEGQKLVLKMNNFSKICIKRRRHYL